MFFCLSQKFKILSILILFWISVQSKAQNLIPNGDFEIYSELPTSYRQLDRAIGWNNTNGIYGEGAQGSPDYFHTDHNFFNWNQYAPIHPASGKGEIGLATTLHLQENFREYIATQLDSTLIPGRKYYLSFYLSNGRNEDYTSGSNNLGFHFSKDSLTQVTTNPISVIPQIRMNQIVYHYDYWKKYEFIFSLTDSADYVTIGNFYTDEQTKYSENGNGGVYYFFDKLELVSYNPPLKIIGDSVICRGEDVELKAINDRTFLWVEKSQPTKIISAEASIIVSPTENTEYLVYSNEDTVLFKLYVTDPPFEVNLGKDTTLCRSDEIILDATIHSSQHGTTFYKWQDDSVVPKLAVKKPGIYVVEVENSGCTVKDTIQVSFRSCTPWLEMPNVFTPNDDGFNDTFIPIQMVNVMEGRLRVFNRWGHLVFETSELSTGWDGNTFSSGIYYWKLQYTGDNHQTGDAVGQVTLLRR